MEPKIIFEDQHLIVVDKPAGLLSQGEKTGDMNLVDWLRQYWGRPYVGLVHRLDRNTSGVMIVAKRTKAAQRLTDALQSDQITRSYLAWVMGKIEGEFDWKHFLLKNRTTNKTRVVRSGGNGAQEALLHAHALKTALYQGKEITLLEIVLETGRSHQIRAQAAAEKHPLLGDIKYGARETVAFARPALHSHRIKFPHPMSQEKLEFEAEIPLDFKSISKTL